MPFFPLYNFSTSSFLKIDLDNQATWQNYYFLLEYNCFTMLHWFLLYNNMDQLYVYVYSLLLEPPSYHPLPIPTVEVITERQAEFPVLYSSFLLSDTSHLVVYIWLCCSLSSYPPSFPYHVHKSIFYVCDSFSALTIKFFSIIFLESIYIYEL